MKSYIAIILSLVLFFGFIAVRPVFAAKLFLENNNQELGKGQEFMVSLFLNTQNQYVNATEGKIIFPSDLLTVKRIQDGNSIINFWITRPSVNQSGTIDFSGIIPGGYHGAKGALFSVVFQANLQGSGAIKISDTKVLLNDGKGTSVDATLSFAQFSITNEPKGASFEPEVIRDFDPPESFTMEISSNPDVFDGKWFLVFATQDKASGVDHYEVREGFFGTFVIAKSPYLLRNQALNQGIFVKAIDKNGNVRLQTLYPPNVKPWYKNYWILGILIIIAMLMFSLAIKLTWGKFTK